MVLEHHADRAVLGGDEHVGRRVVDDRAVDLDAALVDGQQPGQAAQQRGLAGAVGAEHGDDLARLDGERDPQVERAEGDADVGGQAHAFTDPGSPPSQRSRSATSTPNDTTMSTSESTMAWPVSLSRAR